MKQTMFQKASNNLEFSAKRDEYSILCKIYFGETRKKALRKLIHECLFLSKERRFTQEEKDAFERLAKNISDFVCGKEFKKLEVL